MISIQTTGLSLKIREHRGYDEIFDPIRKRWVALTPEEWVRQSLLGFMVQQLKYPASLIAVERGVKVGELCRRFDAMVFNRNGQPWMLIECKAPDEPILDNAVAQLLAYQSVLAAKYILLSNGKQLRCWEIIGTSVMELHALPNPVS
jgi:hypothetical protein